MAGKFSRHANATSAQNAVVVPNTGKTPNATPSARLSAIFSGVTPWRSNSTIGRAIRRRKNPCFILRFNSTQSFLASIIFGNTLFSSSRLFIPETKDLRSLRAQPMLRASEEGVETMTKSIRLVVAGAALVLLFALGVRTGRQTKAAEAREADQAAIAAVLNTQQAAWNRGDVDAFLLGYWHSPKLTFSGSSGVSRGWDGVMARYKKNYPDRAAMGQLDFSELEYRFLGPDAALVLGHWHLKRDKGDIGGVFSLVWQRFPEGWKIVHDHTSAVESPSRTSN